MSLFNLVSNLLTPNYDLLYIVHSPILQEAIDDHDALIDGMVGTLVMKKDPKERVQIGRGSHAESGNDGGCPPSPTDISTREFALATEMVSTFFSKYCRVSRFLQLPRDRTY
jgi:hypothetical protein